MDLVGYRNNLFFGIERSYSFFAYWLLIQPTFPSSSFISNHPLPSFNSSKVSPGSTLAISKEAVELALLTLRNPVGVSRITTLLIVGEGVACCADGLDSTGFIPREIKAISL